MIKPLFKRVRYAILKGLGANVGGVYVLHDEAGAIVYIGCTKCLKTRLKEHFEGGGYQYKYRRKDFHLITFYPIGGKTKMEWLEGLLVQRYRPKHNDLKHIKKIYRNM